MQNGFIVRKKADSLRISKLIFHICYFCLSSNFLSEILAACHPNVYFPCPFNLSGNYVLKLYLFTSLVQILIDYYEN